MNLILQKIIYIFLTGFLTTVYITSEFNFAKHKYKSLIVIFLTLNKIKNASYFAKFEQDKKKC